MSITRLEDIMFENNQNIFIILLNVAYMYLFGVFFLCLIKCGDCCVLVLTTYYHKVHENMFI